MAEPETVLALNGITKRFPGIIANDHVDLTLRRGEILALLGENGAGKSTLMNIIYGLYHADEGTIELKGQPARFSSPRQAIGAGIGMVHQHFQLIPVMTVAENVTLGDENADRVDSEQARLAVVQEPSWRAPARTVWAIIWRALTPIFAIALGLLVGFIVQSIAFVVATHLVSGPPFDSFQFDKLPPLQKATLALTALYPNHVWTTLVLLWLPLVVAVLVGAVTMVIGYRYARRTWPAHNSRDANARPAIDSLLDVVLDWLGIVVAVRDRRRAARRVRALSEQYGLAVDPDALIEQLPVGIQQRVEIVKALYRHADVLILDEPTAVLTPQESQELFRIMHSLAKQGVSIIFITHKLKEVLQVADRIVVMRGGKVTGETTPVAATENSLAEMMVGREVALRVPKGEAHPQDVVLAVDDLCARDDRGTPALDHIDFEVRAGETLGIAGVQGNGQTELVEVLTGLRAPDSGSFSIAGHHFDHITPRELTEGGSAHVPEDRHRYGMVSSYSVADNLVLNTYEDAPYGTAPSPSQLPGVLLAYLAVLGIVFGIVAEVWSAFGWPALVNALNLTSKTLNPRTNPTPFALAALVTIVVIAVASFLAVWSAGRVAGSIKLPQPTRGGLKVNNSAIAEHAGSLVAQFDIRTPSPRVNAGTLSGGNQQKMVVAREFSRTPRLLIAAQPTRGIDVGSIEFIHRRIVAQRDAGAAVLLVSAELDEIMALSDRIAVMYRGRIVATLPADSASREQLGLLMAGASAKSDAPEPVTAT